METEFGKKYVTSEYLDDNPTWHVEDSPWKAEQILKILKRNNLQPDSICEIGCGAGEILRQLLLQMDSKTNFVGYEISPYAFELCMQRKTQRLDYKLYNLFDEAQAYYDIVMAIDVFEHVEDYFSFLRELRSKGEYKIFHIPLEMSARDVFKMSPIMIGREKSGHLHYFSKETALAALRDTGYEIIDYFYTVGEIDFKPAKTLKSFLFKLVRKIGFKIKKDLTVRTLGGYSLMVLTK